MGNFVKWWWDTLTDDTQENILIAVCIIGFLLFAIIFWLLHQLFYPIICCLDIIVTVVIPSGIAIYYFRKQYQEYLDNQEK
jgi:hypothetical protein